MGLCCAFRLADAGHNVALYEAARLDEGCSVGNAGLLVPSHVVPLASPGAFAQGLKWLADPRSPLRVKPTLDPGVLRWLRLFQRAATGGHVARAAPLIARLALEGRDAYATWAADGWEFGFRASGLLQHCRTEHGLAEELQAAGIARSCGIESEVVEGARMRELEPLASGVGGVYYPGDAQLDPARLMAELAVRCQEAGVSVREGCGEARLGALEADWTVVAAGVGSGALAQEIGFRMPLVAGKGYSFLVPAERLPASLPCILVEDRVAASPLGQATRLGGTLEVGSRPGEVDMCRVEGIARAPVRHFGKEVPVPPAAEVWSGLRPCSPDGLPYVGPAPGHPRLVFATGHAMLGVTLAPATARIVQNVVEGRPAPAELSPARYA